MTYLSKKNIWRKSSVVLKFKNRNKKKCFCKKYLFCLKNIIFNRSKWKKM